MDCCNGITLGLLNVSLGAVVVAKSEQQLFGAGLSNMDAPGWASAALFLRGTNRDSWFLGSASFTSCMCSINVPVVLLDGVKKLVVGGFLVDMHECSLVLPGEDDKKDVVAHPAPRAPSIHAQLLAPPLSAPKRINFWPLQLQKSVTPFR